MPFAIARLDRHETVGSAEYTLFRADDPGNPDRQLRAGDGQADFRLSRGQATYESAGAVEAATIDGGTLSLDFARTHLRHRAGPVRARRPARPSCAWPATSAPTAPSAVRDLDSRQYVAGAVSLDGKEAGYLFERGARRGPVPRQDAVGPLSPPGAARS